MNRKRRLNVLRLLSMFCLVAVLVGCGQPVPPTNVTPSGETPIKVPIENIAFNRFIIMGPKLVIDEVVSGYNSNLITPTPSGEPVLIGNPIKTIDLSFLADMGPISVEPPPKFSDNKNHAKSRYSPGDYSEATVELRLYQNPSEDITTLPDLVDSLNTLDERVIANIDFKIVGLDSGTCGDPHSGGGSPFSHSSQNVTIADFEQQWARNAINLSPDPSTSGNHAKLLVLDTAPFSDFDGSETHPLPDGIQVTVSNSIAKHYGSGLISENPGPNVRNHGWEVMSITAAVAPKETEFFLYRVLDDYNCGALFTLLAAILDFLQLMSADPTDRPLCVINASLGVSIPDGVYYEVEGHEDLALEIPSLATIMYEVYRLGCMFVAAAGNDSAPKSIAEPLEAEPKQFPSIYDTVIGVAASTKDGDRSCFSNEGDIAAPGGDGGTDPRDHNKPCAPRTANPLEISIPDDPPCELSSMKNCRYGVIGASTDSQDGFALVSGTSFAAPWVTGVVALALVKVNGDRQLVYCMLQEGTESDPANPDHQWFGEGIIDVSQTLSDDTIAACQDQLGR